MALGTCLGLMIAFASDLKLNLAVAVVFPGVLIGTAVARLFGETAAVLACGASNGAAYGLLLYGWYRLATALRSRIPTWFTMASSWINRAGR